MRRKNKWCLGIALLVFLFLSFFNFVCAGAVRLNEVEANPEGTGDTGKEYVELYSENEINITNWYLTRGDNKTYNLSGVFSGYLVIFSVSNWIIRDSNENITLYNINGEVIDRFFSINDSKNNNKTWQACFYNSSWIWIFENQTRGLENLCPVLVVNNATNSTNQTTNQTGNNSTTQTGNQTQNITNITNTTIPTNITNITDNTPSNLSNNFTNVTSVTNFTNSTNQTSNTSNTPSNSNTPITSIEVIVNCDKIVNVDSEINIDVDIYNLKNKEYDAKVFILDSNEKTLSEIYDDSEDKWKSSFYYLTGIISGPGNTSESFSLRIKSTYQDTIGEVYVYARIRENGGSVYYEGKRKITLEINNRSESYEEDSQENNLDSSSSRERSNTIALNSPTSNAIIESSQSIKSSEINEVYSSKNQKIKQYLIPGFAVFLVIIVTFLILKKEI